MSLALLGLDGNPFTTRDIDASANNFVYTSMLVQPSGNYSTGGDTLPLSTIAGLIPSAKLPLAMIDSVQGTAAVPSLSAAGGYYQIIQNAVPSLTNYLLKIYKNSAGSLAEYSAGAYGTDVLGDVIVLQAQWRKLSN